MSVQIKRLAYLERAIFPQQWQPCAVFFCYQVTAKREKEAGGKERRKGKETTLIPSDLGGYNKIIYKTEPLAYLHCHCGTRELVQISNSLISYLKIQYYPKGIALQKPRDEPQRPEWCMPGKPQGESHASSDCRAGFWDVGVIRGRLPLMESFQFRSGDLKTEKGFHLCTLQLLFHFLDK